jgi:hypothetical protein
MPCKGLVRGGREGGVPLVRAVNSGGVLGERVKQSV